MNLDVWYWVGLHRNRARRSQLRWKAVRSVGFHNNKRGWRKNIVIAERLPSKEAAEAIIAAEKVLDRMDSDRIEEHQRNSGWFHVPF